MAAETANGVLLYQQVNANTFRYTIDLQNSGTTNIGTLWYSWVPGEDFMGVTPTNLVAPAGWSAIVTHSSATDGFAVQFVNSSGPLAAGKVLGGFGFDSSETPAQLTGNSPDFPAMPTGTSFIYGGAPFSDAGTQIKIDPTAFPWQHPFTPMDVDGNGAVQAHDAALIINDLLDHGSHALVTPTPASAPAPFLDVVGDNFVKPSDVNAVITFLLDNPPAAALPMAALSVHATSMSMAAATVQIVPEPASGALAIVAAGLLAFIGMQTRRRRRSKAGPAPTPSF